MKVFLNGKFVAADKAKVSVFDQGYMYGDGVFDTMRAVNGKLWNAEAHVARLFQSAENINIMLKWKQSQVIKWIKETVAKNQLKDARIRVTLSRGAGNPGGGYNFTSCKKPTILIVAVKASPWPPGFYNPGIKLITFDGVRTYPEVKTTSLIINAMAAQPMKAAGADEAILIDTKGHVTEGTSCNIVCIKGDKLIFPKARILPGTTIALVAKLARRLGMKIDRCIVTRRQLYGMDEVFITSVTREVMPVSKIDGRGVGRGRGVDGRGVGRGRGVDGRGVARNGRHLPGQWTRKLHAAFRQMIEGFANG